MERVDTVFTNGCFDIVHRGHIELLRYCQKLGNRVVVGINSDKSVKRLKGKNRPINNQKDRKFIRVIKQQVIIIISKIIIFYD